MGSSFLANTPIVAMLTPAVTRWSDQTGRSASTFLIPLSYATIFGGAITVDHEKRHLVVDNWLSFNSPPKTAVVLKHLRLAVDAVLAAKIDKSASVPEEARVFDVVVKLLNEE